MPHNQYVSTISKHIHSMYVCAHIPKPLFTPLRISSCSGGSVVKNPSANAGDIRDVGSIPGSGRSPGGGYGNLFQYSCLENPMNRGAWRAIAHRVAKSQTRLKRLKMRGG